MGRVEDFIAELNAVEATAGTVEREVYERNRAEVLGRFRRALESLFGSYRLDDKLRDELWREAVTGFENELWEIFGRYMDICLWNPSMQDIRQKDAGRTADANWRLLNGR